MLTSAVMYIPIPTSVIRYDSTRYNTIWI